MRISIAEQQDGRCALLLEGDLAGDGIGALAEEAGRQLDRRGQVVLDLAGVGLIDTAGLLLLRRLTERGLSMRRPSRFVLLLIRQHGLEHCVESHG